jgi:septum formation protein
MSRPRARLLLASASPRRRELLKLLGLPFDVTQADIDETAGEGEAPLAFVARLSEAKAGAALTLSLSEIDPPAAAIVACDTIVVFEGEIIGKPRDPGQAEAMLRRLRAREHAVYTAVSVLDTDTGRRRADVARTSLTMRAYTDREILAYVASGDPLDKAGAYAIQHAGFHPVAELRGCYANVVGLPLCHLANCLLAWGIQSRPGLPARCQAHAGPTCTVFQDILGGI